jgi:hypothetical protein
MFMGEDMVPVFPVSLHGLLEHLLESFIEPLNKPVLLDLKETKT